MSTLTFGGYLFGAKNSSDTHPAMTHTQKRTGFFSTSCIKYCIAVTADVGQMHDTQPDPLSGPHSTVLPNLCK